MWAVLVREHGAPDAQALEEVDTPSFGVREALVDVHSIGINFPDLLVIGGTYQALPPRPFVPGKDAAGVVRVVGPEVTLVRPGDRVLVSQESGCYAEELTAHENNCHVMPGAMSFSEAAAMGLVYQTAYFALIERGGYRSGETVLVHGAAGGVGLAAVQIAKGLGARVLAGVRTAAQADLARANGADAVIDLAGEDLRERVRAQVHAETGGRGADVILDPVGGDVFDASLRALAWCGRLVVVGFAAGRIPEVKANYLLVKNITVSGLQWSDYRDRTPQRVRAAQGILFDLYCAGHVRPHVMQTFALSAFAQALDLVRRGKVQGKVVLDTGRTAA